MFGGFFPAKQSKPWSTGSSILDQIRRWDGISPFQPLEQDVDAPATKEVREFEDHLTGAPNQYDEARLVSEFTELIRLLMRRGNDQARVTLYEAAIRHSIISVIDVILHELNKQSWWQPDKMRPHARWFVHESRHKEPLKFGIALLGLSGTEQDLDDLLMLARYDEFTIYCAIAVGNLLHDPVEQWWQMAKQVHGWGRVHLIKRLSRRAEGRPELQQWLLREGFRNSIKPEYVAYACASAGKLDQVLASAGADDEMIDAACAIVVALIDAGAAENLEDYEGGVNAIRHLLRHLNGKCRQIKRLYAVTRIKDWVAAAGDPMVWERRAEQLGWLPEVRQEIINSCNQLIEQEDWQHRLVQLFRNEPAMRAYIWQIAEAIGLDIWDEGMEALQKDPEDSDLYYWLLKDASDSRAAWVIAFAEKRLNYSHIITGPGMKLLAPGRALKCVDYILAYLRRTHRFSDIIVGAALRCSSVRIRSLALDLIAQTCASDIGDRTKISLEQLRQDEPDIKLRARLAQIGQG
jgi:hypothetical protein